MQETIFGALFDPEDDRVLSVGDEVWRVTIDVVERFVVDGDFECEDYRAGDGTVVVRLKTDEAGNIQMAANVIDK